MRLQNLLVVLVVLPFSIDANPTDIANATNDVSKHRTKRLSGAQRDPDKIRLADHVVSLRSRRPRWYYGDNHFCTGTILTRWYVITSAHCVVNRHKVQHRPRTMLIVAATPDRLRYNPDTTWQVRVQKIWVPLNFILDNTNDIAILRTAERIPLEKQGIAAIKLPTQPLTIGKTCTTLGWGRLMSGGPFIGVIAHIDVQIMMRESCEALVPILNEDMFCAGIAGFDHNACEGDAGAPLFCDGNTLVGTVSYKIGCGTNYKPTIYTDIYLHMDWIESIINKGKRRHLNVLFFYFTCFVILM